MTAILKYNDVITPHG